MIIFLAIMLLVAMREDLATHRIPNRLTIGGTALALIVAAIIGGWPGFKDHFLGALIAGGIFFILWHFGMMGGGDQKLMTAVGAFVGADLALPAVFGVAIAGGFQALLATTIARPQEPKQSLRHALRTTRIPYSLAIALGTVIALLLDHFGRLPQF